MNEALDKVNITSAMIAAAADGASVVPAKTGELFDSLPSIIVIFTGAEGEDYYDARKVMYISSPITEFLPLKDWDYWTLKKAGVWEILRDDGEKEEIEIAVNYHNLVKIKILVERKSIEWANIPAGDWRIGGIYLSKYNGQNY